MKQTNSFDGRVWYDSVFLDVYQVEEYFEIYRPTPATAFVSLLELEKDKTLHITSSQRNVENPRFKQITSRCKLNNKMRCSYSWCGVIKHRWALGSTPKILNFDLFLLTLKNFFFMLLKFWIKMPFSLVHQIFLNVPTKETNVCNFFIIKMEPPSCVQFMFLSISLIIRNIQVGKMSWYLLIMALIDFLISCHFQTSTKL